MTHLSAHELVELIRTAFGFWQPGEINFAAQRLIRSCIAELRQQCWTSKAIITDLRVLESCVATISIGRLNEFCRNLARTEKDLALTVSAKLRDMLTRDQPSVVAWASVLTGLLAFLRS
jgi:hypothetical protein